ncbi:MAG: hypothetical protein WDN06_04545 [Asticcacaulis sp.]
MTADESLSYLQDNQQLKGWRPAPYRVEVSRVIPFEKYGDDDIVTIEIREIKSWA